MNLTTQECAWSQVTIRVLGSKIVGLRGFEFKKTVEKEHIYGSGADPIDIMPGNKKYEGNLKLLKYEVDKLNDAAKLAGYVDLLEVPKDVVIITVMYKKSLIDLARTITANGVAFTELPVTQNQGDKMTEVTLPFLAMGILHT